MVIMPFTHKRNGLGAYCNLIINYECVAIFSTAKYLKVTLDTTVKLTWNKHLSNTLHKAYGPL